MVVNVVPELRYTSNSVSIAHSSPMVWKLTDYMLNDDLDGPQRHITAWHLIRRTSTPLVRWHGLQEVFNGWEQLHRVEDVLLEVLWNIASELPYTLEHELRDPGLLRVGTRPVGGEWLDNTEKQSKESTGRHISVSISGSNP